jgi:N6-L-threonylcarbamoyladenine synthase
MRVLGIETSCDDTGVGIVDQNGTILAHCLYSQIQEHAPQGGVVPEIAARAHVERLDSVIKEALRMAQLSLSDIDGIAATCGPGLIGGVMVGMMTGKAIAAALNKPFIGINHLEAHLLTPRLTNLVPFPYLTLLISGGHTQILLAEGLGDYTLLGESLDDAAGEAFDKAAKTMGLPYPGGPLIEKWASRCTDPAAATARYLLPRPMVGREGCDFSFSGLKTAVVQLVASLPAGPISESVLADICASLQTVIGDVLCDRITNAIQSIAQTDVKHLVLAGGVAANTYLRTRLQNVAQNFGIELVAPPLKLCTDNGVMVAWAGLERLQLGLTSPLDFPARPRWPLIELTGVSA